MTLHVPMPNNAEAGDRTWAIKAKAVESVRVILELSC